MEDKQMLKALRRIYPGDQFQLAVRGEEDTDVHIISLNKDKGFEDGLSRMRPYRVISPFKHTLTACLNEDEVLDALTKSGATAKDITDSLLMHLNEAIILVDMKNDYMKDMITEPVLAKARSKKVQIENEFEKAKNDPEALAGFFEKLLGGADFGPSLSLVGSDDEANT